MPEIYSRLFDVPAYYRENILEIVDRWNDPTATSRRINPDKECDRTAFDVIQDAADQGRVATPFEIQNAGVMNQSAAINAGVVEMRCFINKRRVLFFKCMPS